jgi:C4-type Zn-finger protein
MKSGRCPKCSSTNIYFYEETVGNIPGVTWVWGLTYVCFNCSYLERYLDLNEKTKNKLLQLNQNENRKLVFRVDET